MLVIDDELALVRAYARALSAEGFRVLTASDGATAELMFRQTEVDVVVSDIAMPGVDGIDLLQLFHRIDPKVPVILATGERGDERRQSAVNAGALMFLVKPVDLRALGQIVTHATLLHAQAVAGRGDHASADAPAPPSTAFEMDLARRFEAALRQL
ncbi:MAG TPA: response regulator, partial [Gemmatimonadales bacterium]|nr:response regulator [Gemmatimonadales bacterium]